MALDFPNSPTAGQLYTGPNGVTYQWNATYTAWIPIIGLVTAPVDFFALNNSSQGIPTTWTTLLLPLSSGNAGGWYNASNGRFTPPPGRYFIYVGWAGGLTTTASHLYAQIRKNGTVVAGPTLNTANTNWYGQPVICGNFDANGTDWFDFQATSSSGATNLSGPLWFGAFALPGGAQAALGIGSAWRQIGRIVPTAGQASVDFQNVPSDINDLCFHLDVVPQTTSTALYLQFYDNAGALVTTGYYGANVMTSSASALGSAPFNYPISNGGVISFVYGNTGSLVTNSNGIRGSGRIANIRDATRAKHADYQTTWLADGGSYCSMSGATQRVANGAITGLHFYWSSGNFAAGGAVTLWGSP